MGPEPPGAFKWTKPKMGTMHCRALHPRRGKCVFQVLYLQNRTGHADSLPVYCETVIKRLKGRCHEGLA